MTAKNNDKNTVPVQKCAFNLFIFQTYKQKQGKQQRLKDKKNAQNQNNKLKPQKTMLREIKF